MKLPQNPQSPVSDEEITVPVQAQAGLRTRLLSMPAWLRLMASLIAALTVVLILLIVTLAWVIGTETGTQSAINVTQAISGGALKLTGISGKFADVVNIDELSYQSNKSKLLASGIKLVWQPLSLLNGQLVIDTLDVSSLRLASIADPTPAQLPADLRLPVTISIKHAALGKLSLATLQKDGSELPVLQLSAMTAQLDSTQSLHVLKGALTSPWGRLQLQGQLASSKPFALQSTFSYHGQANKAIPSMGVSGSLRGSLEKLRISAEAMSDNDIVNTAQIASKKNPRLKGGFSALVMAFSTQPLREFEANIEGLNPADFNVGAPQANLRVMANLKTQATSDPASVNKTPIKKATMAGDVLAGNIQIENLQHGRIDQNALPILSLRSDVQWSDTLIFLKDMHVQLSGNGKVVGHADIQIPATGLPLIDANFNVNGINLAQLDKRIQSTQIAGAIHAQTSVIVDAQKTSRTVLAFQAQLKDPRASLKIDANYLMGEGELDSKSANGKNNTMLKLTQFELIAADSRVQGKGEIDFSGTQKFNFQGNLKRFDPSRWLKMPAGHIDAEMVLTGQLQPNLTLNVQLPRVAGDYAGQAMSGAMDVRWQRDIAVTVKKLDLHWGKNMLNAHGIWGNDKDGLMIKLDAPDLPALSTLLGTNLTGSMQAEALLLGTIAKPAGKISLTSQGVGVEAQMRIDHLTAAVELGNGQDGTVNAEVQVRGVRANLSSADKGGQAKTLSEQTGSGQKKPGKMALIAEQLGFTIKGRRDAHQIELNARLNAAHQFVLSASGSLKPTAGNVPQWSGQVARLTLNGKPDLKLLAPMQIAADQSAIRIGGAHFSSALGKIMLEQFEWMPGSIKTRGQMTDVKLIDVLNLAKPQYAIEGDLQVKADWDLQLKDNVRGALHMQRQSGDIRVNDIDGTGQALALGVSEVQLNIVLGGLVAGTDAERIVLDLQASGLRLGNWRFRANSQLRKNAEQWELPDDAALAGNLQADVSDLQWLGPWLNPGLALKGKLNVDATLSGMIGTPQYQAKLEGRELEVAFASEGILLPNGSLSALVDEKHVKLNQLHFSNKVSIMPKHAKFRDISYVGQTGEFNASGEIDIGKQSGSIQVQFQKFPLLQRKDRWVIVSGQTSINQSNNIWALTGKLVADGAYFKLPKSPPPRPVERCGGDPGRQEKWGTGERCRTRCREW